MNFHIWKELLGYYGLGCYRSTTDPAVKVKRCMYMVYVEEQLKHYTTSWKVEGPIPNGVIGCVHPQHLTHLQQA
jgi:hypothetical protein